MTDSGPTYSSLSVQSMINKASEKMTDTPTPQADSSEVAPESTKDSSSRCPSRLSHSHQHAQNNPIQIPKITTNIPDMSIPKDPAVLARGLEDKCVDEFGNILDWNGTVLGRVEGDLPSMVGRCVSSDGRVRDGSGHAVGHVSENHIRSSPSGGHSSKRLKIDHTGNIYDHHGALVGKMKDHSKENKTAPAQGCARCRERSNDAGAQRQQQKSRDAATDDDDVPRQAAAPSPSDIYLDVKSTHDGIQLIIKIPTAFNQHRERR